MKLKTVIFTFLIALFLGSATNTFGQNSISDLKPAHAQTLRRFLAANKKYSFLSARKISAQYLKMMRGNMGENFQPYYLADDFNRDRKPDFAVILSRRGARKTNRGVTSEEHIYSYPLTVVIFNGSARGGFTKAAAFDVESPYVCFLTIPDEESKILHYGVYETDAYELDFKPAGKSYRAEAPEML